MGIAFFKSCLQICCCRKQKPPDQENGEDIVQIPETGNTDPPSETVPSGTPDAQNLDTPAEVVIELSESGENGGTGGGGLAPDSIDAAPKSPSRASPLLPPPSSSKSMITVPPTPSDVGPSDSASNIGDTKKSEAPAGEEPEPIALAGRLLVEFTYIPGAEKLNVLIIRADSLPEKERGGSSNIIVHLTILPTKKQRFRTKIVPASKGVFNEKFQFVHVTPDIIEDCTLRMRLYGKERFGKRVMGEINIPMKGLDLTSPLCDEPRWKTLLPKGIVLPDPTEEMDDTLSLGSLGPRDVPELLVSLHYVDWNGRLTVGIVKGANFRTKNMKQNPDTFVKVRVVSGKGKRIGRSLTTMRLAMSDPEYNESFVYPMTSVDLLEATMMISVYAKRKGRRKPDIIGWIAMGKNGSGDMASRHWSEMKLHPDVDCDHWHKLMEV